MTTKETHLDAFSPHKAEGDPEWYCTRALAVPLIRQWQPRKRQVADAARAARPSRLAALCCWTEPGAS